MVRASRSILLAAPLIALLTIVVLFFGIRDDPDARKIAARMSDTHTVRLIGDAARPAVLALPPSFDAERSYLLLIGLHAYGSNAWQYDQYLRLSALGNSDDLALLLPQGLKNADGSRFWNATPWCCAPQNGGVDDAAYIASLLEDAAEIVRIEQVAAVGYANGGFLAHRLACDGLDGLTAVVSLAGSSFADAERCADAAPVSVLQIHGDADDQVLYGGELGSGGYPGALAVAHRWARRAGCDAESPADAPPLDLDRNIDGAETAVQRWTDGCADGIIVELWTIQGGGHEPDIEEAIGARIVEWLRRAAR